MKEYVCIICPRGCHLAVDEENDYAVTGNGCLRGAAYGREEAMHPTRIVTSSVRVRSRIHPRCPVKTDKAIAKSDIMKAMLLLDDVELSPPVRRGDVVIASLFGGEANFIATRDIDE
ncbi:MAG TPA: DUF1667 domain-containing protein [Clostridiaceae bacterium]|jgi:CxxC motif-containing protein|nr:DUF1667 domain-containing protein [Clostridiaceae bacterium]